MRSLGRLVRGLSALFWGLPAALVICFHTARAEGMATFGVVPAMVATGVLLYGLWQMGGFQPQERVWRRALDLAKGLALVNFGLSPFLYFWNRLPGTAFFFYMVLLMLVTGLLFLASLNHVLKRLGAMLPDEALRVETRQFTALNLNMLLATFLLVAIYLVLRQARELPFWLEMFENAIERGSFWFLILLVLLPLAMTMALLWKTKEVILENIFGPGTG
jgi:hypothetical protein